MIRRFLILLAALLVCVQSFAAAPVQKLVFDSYPGSPHYSAEAACAAVQAAKGAPYDHVVKITDLKYECWSRYASGEPKYDGTVSGVMKSLCEDNSAPDLTKPLAQQCPDKCPVDGTDGPNVEYTTGWRTGPDGNSAYASGPSATPPAGCVSGCVVNVWGKNPWVKNAPGANGYYEAGFDLKTMYTGGTCTGSPDLNASKPPEPTVPPPEKNRCPLGTKQIGTDSAGTPICFGDKPDVDPKKQTTTTTTTNADGSKTTTKTETTTNSDGSTTTKTTTTTTNADGSDGGTREQTTTGNTPDGKAGKSDSTDQDKSDLCKQHPTLNICRNSEFSGACESVSCSGDAIQCAIARQQAKEACQREKDRQEILDSSPYALGKAILDGNDPKAGQSPLDPANGSTFDVPTSLQDEKFLGEGACFPDYTIPIRGMSFVIPFSQACPHILPLRYALMVAAMIVSLYIVQGTMRKV